MNFSFKNKTFEYFLHPHNNTSINERRVEISLAHYFIKNINSFLEIGCVTPYYFHTNHEVYDLTDAHPKCKNIDADILDLNNKNILSISTIEHFGIGDYGNNKQNGKAIKFLEKLLNLNNKYLITWALGYNIELDKFVFSNIKNANYICRHDNKLNTWIQKKYEELTEIDKKYGTFHCANSICVLENIL